MRQPTDRMTNQQARLALKSIADSKQHTIDNSRPPILLLFGASLSYAAIFFGYGMTEHENLWALFMWGGAAGFILFVSLSIYTLRILGVKVSIIPRTKASHILNLTLAVIFAILIVAGRELRIMGFTYAPHIASLLAFLVMFISLTKYPTGEYIESNATAVSDGPVNE